MDFNICSGTKFFNDKQFKGQRVGRREGKTEKEALLKSNTRFLKQKERKKSYKSETDSCILITWCVSTGPLATFLGTNWPRVRSGLPCLLSSWWPLSAQWAHGVPSRGEQEGLQAEVKLITGNRRNWTQAMWWGQQGRLTTWEAGSPQKECWWPPGGCSFSCPLQATLPNLECNAAPCGFRPSLAQPSPRLAQPSSWKAKDSMQILKWKFCSIQIFYWKEGRELSGPELFKWLSYEEVRGPAHIKQEVCLPCSEANKGCAHWKLRGWKCLWELNGPGLSLWVA